MRYLKTYKIFENKFQAQEDEVEPILQGVRDILLELTDENWDEPKSRFKIKVQACGPVYNYKDKLRILIQINRPEGFIIKDIEDVMDRVNTYLLECNYINFGKYSFNGYNYSLVYRHKDNYFDK